MAKKHSNITSSPISGSGGKEAEGGNWPRSLNKCISVQAGKKWPRGGLIERMKIFRGRKKGGMDQTFISSGKVALAISSSGKKWPGGNCGLFHKSYVFVFLFFFLIFNIVLLTNLNLYHFTILLLPIYVHV